MCGRYYIDQDDAATWLQGPLTEIQRRYAGSPELMSMRLGEIFPSHIVPVLARDGARLMRWGYTGYKNRVINARSETAAEKPMFRNSLAARRCLIPASGYYEWKRTQSGAKTKHKYAFHRPEEPLYMAGLWREEKAEPLPVFVILTREAGPGIADIHDRMPVILPQDALDSWVAGGDAEWLMRRAVQDMAFRLLE